VIKRNFKVETFILEEKRFAFLDDTPFPNMIDPENHPPKYKIAD